MNTLSLNLQHALPPSLQLSSWVSWPVSSRSLPTSPGIYIFATPNNQVIYIGKAKNLKNRISSYKLSANQIGKTKSLVTQAQKICWVEVNSELQAIILEAHCIKLLTPKFNLRLKDDKSPLYIIITSEKFPRVLTSRKPAFRSLKIENYFGPFSSSLQTRKLLQYARKVFPFCNATPLQKSRHQPCFYLHLGLCSGACNGQVSVRTYRAMIRHLVKFLQGDQERLVSQLTRSMKTKAKVQQYEAAGEIRNQLNLLTQLLQTKSLSIFSDEVTRTAYIQKALHELAQTLRLSAPPQRIEGYDIANIQGKHATGAMVVMRNGQPLPSQYRHFKITSLTTPNDPAMISEVIYRRLNHPEWPHPDLIVVDGGITQLNAALSVTSRYPQVASRLSVVGLAKREETIVTTSGNIHLPPHSPALQLLQTLRDEAHRFSRRLHHHIHQKQSGL